jgi:autotransporter family porin
MKFRILVYRGLIVLALGGHIAAAQPPGRGNGGPARAPRGGSPEGPSAAPAEPEELIRMFDRDGDGRISRAEAPPRMLQRWDQIDTNHDGYVTVEELKARDARVGTIEKPSGRVPAGADGGDARAAEARLQPGGPLTVITVGTGSPQYDPRRSGPSTLIQHRGKYFLVDMGNGTQAQLNTIGMTVRQFDALLLTHHHLDHNEEFIPLFIHTRLAGGRPEIIGPPGTAKLVDFIMDFYAEDIDYRLHRNGRTMADFGRAAIREIQGGEQFRLGDIQVTTARVNHSIHTVAYRFDAEGRSIVISGDLSYTEALVELARAADVLVIDSGAAIVHQGQPAVGRRTGEGTRPPGHGNTEGLHAHASFQEVAEMSRKSRAKRLVLTHIAPGEVDEVATIRALGESYPGEIIVGRDLLEVPATGEPRQLATVIGSSKESNVSQVPPSSSVAATVGVVPARITGSVRVYVRANATGRDGKSWGTAFPTIQAGIDAVGKQGGGEVWVAKGTYYPTTGNDRNATIQLRSGVAVYGGFVGTETRLEQRDWQQNQTILSGDIGRKDVRTDNSYHVVTGADNALLDGFLISGGYAMDAAGSRPPGPPSSPLPPGSPGVGTPQGPLAGGPAGGRREMPGSGPIHTTPDAILSGQNRSFGAGMLNFQCAPTLRNCTFQDNQAGKGGAVYNMVSQSFPPRRDTALPSPLFIDCRFLDNHARARGGAIANDLGTSPTLRGCTLLKNSCDDKGGAIYNDFGCSPTLVQCLLAENRATSAGAIGNDGGSSPRISHCTFVRNIAQEEGAALYQGTGPANNPVVVGCIFWGNRCENGPADVFNWHDNDPQFTGCCLEGGYPGEGNFAKDPGFVDLAGGDYRLRADSPCKDIGHTAATTAEMAAVVDLGPPLQPHRPSASAVKSPEHIAGAAATICYVRAANTSGPWDGKSWRTAFASLQDALAAASAHCIEIWIAAGTYKATAGTDRTVSFALSEGIELYGGFRGTETKRSQRDWKTNLTVLSGDIGRSGDASDNSYHVVIGADHAVLDGLIIRDGNADGRTYDGKGGGMINYRRGVQSGPMGAPTGYSPVVRNCAFSDNRAREGGAVYNYDRGQPQFVDCRFLRNSADYGGAMVDRVGVRSVLTGCEFLNNEARWRAGAIYLDYGACPRITNGRFQGNHSQCHGGALATISRASQLESTIPVLERCSFVENTAQKRGGAIANSDHCILALEGCTFTDNHAVMGGGALSNDYRTRAVLIDCRFSGNRSDGGEAELATDAGSTVSRNRADWPEQTAPSRPMGTYP